MNSQYAQDYPHFVTFAIALSACCVEFDFIRFANEISLKHAKIFRFVLYPRRP